MSQEDITSEERKYSSVVGGVGKRGGRYRFLVSDRRTLQESYEKDDLQSTGSPQLECCFG